MGARVAARKIVELQIEVTAYDRQSVDEIRNTETK